MVNIDLLVRNFKENGFKFLLESPANLRDFVQLVRPALTPHLDFPRMELLRGTFIEPNFQHLESDLFLRLPLLGQSVPIHLYALIEHQSNPDKWALLRALRYVLSAFEWQQKMWLVDHETLKDFRLRPVLPILLYSGHKSWTDPKTLSELIGWQGLEAVRAEVEPYVPDLQMIFFNLTASASEQLCLQGGFLGQIFHVFQKRMEATTAFEAVLRQTVTELEGLAQSDWPRWQQMMWYLRALLYNERESDGEQLAEQVCDWVRIETGKREVLSMATSYAERMRVETTVRTQQNTLVRQIKRKFNAISPEMEQIIRSTQDLPRLEGWLDAVITAERPEDLGIAQQP